MSPTVKQPTPVATMRVPFHRPFVSGDETTAISDVLAGGYTGGNGPVSTACEQFIADLTGTRHVLLTHSCTGALEMAALLTDVGPGDEVIMPSFTFVTTATAFVLRGATPVFVEVSPGHLSIDPEAVEKALTPKTKAIVPVHYGGGAADMAAIEEIATSANVAVVEDAAQSIFAKWRGRSPGAIGNLGTFSFHETKNLSCGEGGALLINDPTYLDRAEILQEKGTNRTRFVRGELSSYEWIDVGSSFLMSDISAAVLSTQLAVGQQITDERRAIWSIYDEGFAALEQAGRVTRPHFPADVEHNAHTYWLLAADNERRGRIIDHLRQHGIRAQFHYVPLHSAPAGRRYGREGGDLTHTTDVASRLVRLPLWAGMSHDDAREVVERVNDLLA